MAGVLIRTGSRSAGRPVPRADASGPAVVLSQMFRAPPMTRNGIRLSPKQGFQLGGVQCNLLILCRLGRSYKAGSRRSTR